ncbi:RNA polymerase sigma factor [Paenibacillus sp. GCM10012307]|uniref:RNA polymerase sigma factor n=1 Tax=Paenibacillus roseus TaxID=2798579 RepID=A0A934J401_9BACL|nr:RNA polymerase sigma factor [Paenibacillus roseus]MBJ6360411.1 RNA polymerase sigma factor [Paenibacillus roseus]
MRALPNENSRAITKTQTETQQDEKVAQLHADLLRYCIRLTGSRHAAEDLVQDTCVKAIRMIQQKMPHPNPAAYLKRVARNQWIDQVRRSARYEERLKHSTESFKKSEASDEAFEHDEKLEEALKLVIACLSPLQRTVYLLREALSLTGPETAALLDTTEGAVKAALNRARFALSRMLEGDDATDDAANSLTSVEIADISLLQAYSAALQLENTGLLVQLMNNDRLDPAASVIVLRNYASQARKAASVPQACLAA